MGLTATLAALRVGGRVFLGVQAPEGGPGPQGERILSNDEEILAVVIALAMLGDAAEAAWRDEVWNPANRLDVSLMSLYPDQIAALRLALHLVEELSWGLGGFSGEDREEQRAILSGWATSAIPLRRTVWGSLHALSCAGFGQRAAWELMNYPGPCVASMGLPGRPPGQTVAFEWDERVP